MRRRCRENGHGADHGYGRMGREAWNFPAAAMKARIKFSSTSLNSYSGYHCSPMQNGVVALSMHSITPSSAVAVTAKRPGPRRAWRCRESTCAAGAPANAASR